MLLQSVAEPFLHSAVDLALFATNVCDVLTCSDLADLLNGETIGQCIILRIYL